MSPNFVKPSRPILVSALLMLFSAQEADAGFTVSGATVTLTGATILSTVGDVTLLTGSLDAGNASVEVGGDWIRNNGTFIPGTSTVTFQGTLPSVSTIAGSSTFYSFQCVTAGKTLSFAAGSTQTVVGPLILTGTVGNPLRIRSSISGSYAFLTNSGTNTVNNVDVQDNNATGGVTIMARAVSIDSGHTVNWFFAAPANPPSGLAGIALGISSISWTWNAVAGASSYTMYNGVSALFIRSVGTNSLIETGLLENRSYSRVVTAVVSGLESNPSNSVTVNTLLNAVPGELSNNLVRLIPGSPYPRMLTPNRSENRRLFFLFNTLNSDPISLSIYDVQGRKVRDLDRSASAPIAGAVVWDVKDDSGHIVPSGIYLYKIKAGNQIITGSVVVAR